MEDKTSVEENINLDKNKDKKEGTASNKNSVGIIRMLSFAIIALAIILGYVISNEKEKVVYKRELKNIYDHSFNDIVFALDSMEDVFDKMRLYSTPNEMAKSFGIIDKQMGNIESSIEDLPFNANSLNSLTEFLNQVSDFSNVMLEKGITNEELKEEEKDAIKMFSKYAKSFRDEILKINDEISNGNDIDWNEVKKELQEKDLEMKTYLKVEESSKKIANEYMPDGNNDKNTDKTVIDKTVNKSMINAVSNLYKSVNTVDNSSENTTIGKYNNENNNKNLNETNKKQTIVSRIRDSIKGYEPINYDGKYSGDISKKLMNLENSNIYNEKEITSEEGKNIVKDILKKIGKDDNIKSIVLESKVSYQDAKKDNSLASYQYSITFKGDKKPTCELLLSANGGKLLWFNDYKTNYDDKNYNLDSIKYYAENNKKEKAKYASDKARQILENLGFDGLKLISIDKNLDDGMLDASVYQTSDVTLKYCKENNNIKDQSATIMCKISLIDNSISQIDAKNYLINYNNLNELKTLTDAKISSNEAIKSLEGKLSDMKLEIAYITLASGRKVLCYEIVGKYIDNEESNNKMNNDTNNEKETYRVYIDINTGQKIRIDKIKVDKANNVVDNV